MPPTPPPPRRPSPPLSPPPPPLPTSCRLYVLCSCVKGWRIRDVSRCELMWVGVSRCEPVWAAVSRCEPVWALWAGVSRCEPCVSLCEPCVSHVWAGVSRCEHCEPVWAAVSRCEPLWALWAGVSRCEPCVSLCEPCVNRCEPVWAGGLSSHSPALVTVTTGEAGVSVVGRVMPAILGGMRASGWVRLRADTAPVWGRQAAAPRVARRRTTPRIYEV